MIYVHKKMPSLAYLLILRSPYCLRKKSSNYLLSLKHIISPWVVTSRTLLYYSKNIFRNIVSSFVCHFHPCNNLPLYIEIHNQILLLLNRMFSLVSNFYSLKNVLPISYFSIKIIIIRSLFLTTFYK